MIIGKIYNNIYLYNIVIHYNSKEPSNERSRFFKSRIKNETIKKWTRYHSGTGSKSTVPFVSNVENNRAKLNLRVLLYYSKLCNVSVDTILDAGRDLPPLDEKERQLNDEVLNVFRGFSVAEKEKIIKMLRIWQEK